MIKELTWLPCGAVDKNPPANAGDTEFCFWSRKIPHAVVRLKPVSHNYWACALETRATTMEAWAP